VRGKENTYKWVSVYLNLRLNTKTKDLNVSHTLGCVGRNNSKSSIGFDVHSGDTRSVQTR
jgi:hypothetical protein